jgi:2TM domain
MDEAELEKAARRRVQMKRGFFIHLLLYVAVNSMLIVIWSVTGRGYPWFVWPLAGWGIGILANGITVAMEVFAPEERAIEREMRRMRS